jgi:hypothetical protein
VMRGLVPMLLAAFTMAVPDAALGSQRMMEICSSDGQRKVIVVEGDPSAPQDTPHCDRKACHAACQRKLFGQR